MKHAAVSGLVLLLACAAAGCLFAPHRDDPSPPPPGPPLAETPDQLMANFKTAYSGRNLADYGTVLSPDYQFILRPEDVAGSGISRFTLAEETHIAQNMFSGSPVQKPDGTTAPAISSITVSVLTRSQPWSPVGASDPDFPLTERSLYDIQISFARDGYNTIVVTGSQEFFVSWRDTVVNGVTKPFCQLRGQRDLSNWIKIDETSWGQVKGAYE